MADRVVIGHPVETAAQSAFDTAVGLQRDLILGLAGVAIVHRREEGRLNMVTPTGATAAAAARRQPRDGLIALPAAGRPATWRRVTLNAGPRHMPLPAARQTGALRPAA